MSDTKRFQPTKFPAPQNSPVVALAFYIRGKELAEAGRLDSAIAEYDTALTINPMFAAALAERGDAWAKKGDFERAIADYNTVLQINPRDVKTRMSFTFALGKKFESETRNAEVVN
jgi:tetratricopeptide (TPR) repeat protein